MQNFDSFPVFRGNRSTPYGIATIFFLCLLFTISTLAFSQTSARINGWWQWQEQARRDREQNGFSLDIIQQGKRVHGVYSLLTWMNGEPQIEDGNQTPFIGTVKGNVITIKFDPDNIHPGYEQNVRYKNPANGRPSTATLVMTGGKLQLALTSGKWPENARLPRQFTLRRTR